MDRLRALRTPLLVAATVISGFVPTGPVAADDWIQQRRQGDEAVAKQDFRKALAHYKQVPTVRDPGIDVQLCECHLRLKDYANAEIACNRYLAGAKERTLSRSPDQEARARHYLAEAKRALLSLSPAPEKVPSQAFQPSATGPLANEQGTKPNEVVSPVSVGTTNTVVAERQTQGPEARTSSPIDASRTEFIATPVTVIDDSQSASTAIRPLERSAPRARNTGLWSAGLTLWLSSYAAAAAIGLNSGLRANAGQDGLSPQDAHYHLWLAAPLIGPFVSGALRPIEHPDEQASWLLNWTLPWIVADGMSQVAGLIMLAAGANPRSPATQIVQSVRIAPSPTGGGTVTLLSAF